MARLFNISKSSMLLVLMLLTVSAPRHTYAQALPVEDPARRALFEEHVDFVTHVLSHKERTVKLMVAGRILFPEVFGKLSIKEVIEFGSLHDNAKLEKYFIERLSRGPTDKQDVDKLNAKDMAIRFNYFRKNRAKGYMIGDSLTPKARLILRLENLGDLTDRGIDPISALEYGRVKMKFGSDYLKNSKDRKMAAQLEKRYAFITEESDYLSKLGNEVCSNLYLHIAQRPIN